MPTARRKPLGLTEAAAAAGLDPDDLLRLFDEIRAASEAGGKVLTPPEPIYNDGEPNWDRDDYRRWALRMGYWSPYRGRRLIGYAGIAWRTGLTEQWLRKLRGKQAERGPQPEDMPDPVNGPSELVFFDLTAILRWARQTGKLNAPDRRTTS